MNRSSRPSLNLSFLRKRPTEYHYIQDFENTTERECKRCDKNNDAIYERNIALYTKTKKFLDKNHAIFKMEGPPASPRVPSNYELYVIHQNRNSLTNNKIQTMAILFLLQNQYKLVIDPCVEFIPKVMNRENKLFEPYMAIDIASSINKNFIEEIAKYYEMKGERLGSPELLSIEEKIDKFNKDGMIQYIDVGGETSTENQKIERHISAPPGTLPQFVKQKPMRSATFSAGDMTSAPILPSMDYFPQFNPSQAAQPTQAAPSAPSAPPAPPAPSAPSAPSAPLATEKNELPPAAKPPTPLPDGNPPAYGIDNTNNTNEDGKINIFINK